MATIAKPTFDEIVTLLVSEFSTEQKRRDWLDIAFVENPTIVHDIDCSGSPLEATSRIVTALAHRSDPGEDNFLWLFLSSLAPNLGIEKEQKIFDLKPLIIEATDVLLATTPHRNPYKGFRAFTIEDDRDFFGREKLTTALLDTLQSKIQNNQPRFLGLVGKSGSGKSSVVMAGLLPALKEGKILNSDRWSILSPVRPGEHPVENLSAAIYRKLSETTVQSIEAIQSDLQNPRTLHLIGQSFPSDQFLVVFIDQFEELFTHMKDENEQKHFINLICTAANEKDGRVIVITTLRADFYDRPMQFPVLGELFRNHQPIYPMSISELYEAVRRPAQQAGLSIENDLVAELVFEVRDAPGSLPLLQFTLDQLYQVREGSRMTMEAYRALGGDLGDGVSGLRGVLAKRANELYEGLSEQQQETMKRVLLRLVEVGEETIARRRAERSELSLKGVSETEVSEILERLTASDIRLLVASSDANPDGGKPVNYYEVSHEALLTHWEQLKEWIAENRNDLRLDSEYRRVANEWTNSNRDKSFLFQGMRLEVAEQWLQRFDASTQLQRDFIQVSQYKQERDTRQERERQAREIQLQKRALNRTRILAAAFAVFLVIAIGLSLFALDRQYQSEINLREANIQGTQASLFSAQAVAKANRSESQRLAASADFVFLQNYPELAALLSVSALNTAYSSQADSSLMQSVWQLRTRQIYTGPNSIIDAAFSPDGQYVLTGGTDGTARLWETLSGKEIRVFSPPEYGSITGGFSPDGQIIFLIKQGTTGNSILYTYDAITGEQQSRIDTIANAAYIDYLPNQEGFVVLVGEDHHTFQVINPQTGAVLKSYTREGERITCVDIAPKKDLIAFCTGWSSSSGGNAEVWDLKTGQKTIEIKSPANGEFDDVAFSPNGEMILTGYQSSFLGEAYVAQLWYTKTGNLFRTFDGHTNSVRKVAFSPSGDMIATLSSIQGTIIVWNAKTGEQKVKISYPFAITGIQLSFSPDENYLLITTGDEGGGLVDVIENSARLLDISLNVREREAKIPEEQVLSLQISQPDPLTVHIITQYGKSLSWDVKQRMLTPQKQLINSEMLAVSPDGRYAVVQGFLFGEVDIISLDSSSPDRTIKRDFPIDSAVFSTDSQHFYLGENAAFTHEIIVYDTTTLEIVKTFDLPRDISSIALFGNDGLLVGGSGMVRLIVLETGQSRDYVAISDDPYRDGSENTVAVAVSPDGTRFVTATTDYILRVWDVSSGQILREIRGLDEDGWITSLVFLPDGNQFISGTHKGIVRLWDRDYRQSAGYVCQLLPRTFEKDEINRYAVPKEVQDCKSFDYDESGEPARILEYYDDLLTADASNDRAYAGRGYFFFLRKDYEHAVQDYSKAIELDPTQLDYYYRGIIYRELGKLDEAIADLTSALDLNPEFTSAYNIRAYAYFEQGKLEQAIADVTQAIQLAPDNPNFYDSRCEIYLRSEQWALGIADCDKALTMGWTFSDEMQALFTKARQEATTPGS